MYEVIATLKSVSPYSQSRPHITPKIDKESPADHDMRTWREKCHCDEQGNVVIPGIAFKNCLGEIAQYLGEKIPGKRNATWTKHFQAGILVLDSIPVGIKKDDLEHEAIYCNADGKKGSGTRVWRCFPVIRQWKGDLKITVLDETITEDVLKHHLEEAGKFLGIGRWRPRNGGMYGRFEIVKMKKV